MRDIIHEDILTLDIDKINFSDIAELKGVITKLLSTIECLAQSNRELREENQRLKDEINHLKGEKGKPKVLPNNPQNKPNKVIKKTSEWHKGSKKSKVKIDRVKYVQIDKSKLPRDAVHIGFRKVVKQNIKFNTDNVEYRLERYYSPSLKKSYEADLPEALQNTEFGSDLKAFVMYLYYAGRVTENKIKRILEESGIIISEGEISNILTKEKSSYFSAEKDAIFNTGFRQADYLHIDETGARHRGNNYYMNVVCNECFSAFFTSSDKGNDTVRAIFGLKEDELLDKPVISDDAKQFMDLSQYPALCWLHEIRHYIKMDPYLHHNKSILNDFLTKLWRFYNLLVRYKCQPNNNKITYILRRFNSLFSTKTGYIELDERIALTKKKKERLLLILKYPFIPLHNNTAEIAVREGVIKRKISYGTRSENGRIAWENMLSIMDTCRKVKVSFFKYLQDIFSNNYSMPRLSYLIERIC